MIILKRASASRHQRDLKKSSFSNPAKHGCHIRMAALAPLRADKARRKGLPKPTNKNNHASHGCFALCRPGGYGGAAAPVPIPNTAVKRPSANGTSSQDAGE
jgi:hypothetical protein